MMCSSVSIYHALQSIVLDALHVLCITLCNFLCTLHLKHLLLPLLTITFAPQWSYKVWQAQHVLGSLYERIYNTIRARGVPPEDETVLWACLARLKDPATGGDGGD
jgi:ABC-type dipeptide/oligopeptide/nickel transport system permease component